MEVLFFLDVFPFQAILIFSGVVIVVYLVKLLASYLVEKQGNWTPKKQLFSQWGFSYHDGHDDAASVIGDDDDDDDDDDDIVNQSSSVPGGCSDILVLQYRVPYFNFKRASS